MQNDRSPFLSLQCLSRSLRCFSVLSSAEIRCGCGCVVQEMRCGLWCQSQSTTLSMEKDEKRSLRRVGFEPTSTNTLRPEHNPLDRSGICASTNSEQKWSYEVRHASYSFRDLRKTCTFGQSYAVQVKLDRSSSSYKFCGISMWERRCGCTCCSCLDAALSKLCTC